MTAIERDAQGRIELVTLEAWRRAEFERRLSAQDPPICRSEAAQQETSSPSPSTTETIQAEPKTKADLSVAELFRFAALDHDWDGNEAAKPLAFSIKDAHNFIRALAPESIVPRPALHADGHAILFVRDSEKYVELEFLGGRRIGFYARRGSQEWADEFDFDGHTLPAGLSMLGFDI
jgi:hypothetical protein